jgi:RNA polymerase sigma-70 factor (ECF subfamily)
MDLPAQPKQQAMAPPAPAAFEALYRGEFKAVCAFLQRLGARGSVLEDLTHDVFLTALRRFDRYDPARPAAPWLKGIAWRLASDHRSLHRHQQEAPEDEGLDVPSAQALPDEAMARLQAQRILQEALATLDLERRTVFVMADIEGHAVTEIAQLMEAPVATTHSRLRLAREQLSLALHRIRLRRGIS